MTDQTIPAGISPEEAKKAREWALHALNKPGASTTAEKAVARVVIGTVPEPRPTLADMTREERAACQWIQADHPEYGRVIVLRVDDDGDPDAYRVLVLEESGEVARPAGSRVTPRPDLPRLEWPADDQEAEDATTAKVGDMIESADDPRIDALPVGSILLDREGEVATNRSMAWTGRGYVPIESQGDEFGPWTVLHIPKETGQ